MQLEKSSDPRIGISPFELNATNFVTAEQERQKQADVNGMKPSIDSSVDSLV